MCGFAGFCDIDGRFSADGRDTVRKMSDMIVHRGPDSRGEYSDGFLSVGFCRLRITGSVGGDQPMLSDSGRYLICFNGEIYNYKELREELERKFGIRFGTDSDTEVLLYACAVYGRAVLPRLRGMFSFVFYDREKSTLFMARDPFGIKPLYYGYFNGSLIFASEIKAFLPHPDFKKEFNFEILPYYLQFQYVPTEETAFKGVKRLMPGCILSCDGGGFVSERYFSLPKAFGGRYRPYSFFGKDAPLKEKQKNGKKAAEEVFFALSKSVGLHKESGVALGAFLSGGVDSGLVCAMARPKRTYSVGFSETGFDERGDAKAMAERIGAEFISVGADADAFFAALPCVQYHSDEPYANLSAVPLYLMARRASKDVKVILSGEGADELFGGYEWYADGRIGRLYKRLPRSARRIAFKLSAPLGKRVRRFTERNLAGVEEEFIGQARIMTAEKARLLLKKPLGATGRSSDITSKYYGEVQKSSELRKKMYLDQNLWLPLDILNKADKMTMASSVELRVPYLDLKVLSAAEGLSDGLLVKNRTTKYLLRRAAERALPKSAARRRKKGFPVPFREWIKDERYKNILLEAFNGKTASRFFDVGLLVEMLNAHFDGRENNARVLYTVYAFIVWYDCFFDRSSLREFP